MSETKPRITLDQMKGSLDAVVGAAAEAPLPARGHEAVGRHVQGLVNALEDWNARLASFEQGDVKLTLVKDEVQH